MRIQCGDQADGYRYHQASEELIKTAEKVSSSEEAGYAELAIKRGVRQPQKNFMYLGNCLE